jgi:integrase
MARRPKLAVIYEIKTRVNKKTGTERYSVRWRVIGRPWNHPWRSFTELAEAEALHGELTDAANEYERFDMRTGLPVSMLQDDEVSIVEWCKEFVDRDAKKYVPKSRANLGQDLVALIVRSAPDRAPALSSEQAIEIDGWLAGKVELSPEVAKWLERWSPKLRDLDRDELERILERVSLKEDLKTLLASSSQSNRRSHVRQVLNDAVNCKKVKSLDWPPAKKGAQKKSERPEPKRRKIATSPTVLDQVIDLSSNRDRRSHKYRVMNAISGLGGLRPSEVYGLEATDLLLPSSGWGEIQVNESRVSSSERWAMDGDLEYDQPKSTNSTRTVPIPPQLVAILAGWLEETGITEGRIFPDGLGFRHWPDSLALACEKAGTARLSPYDLRRAYASHLHATGLADAKISARMGNTVEILRKHYLLDVEGSDTEANAKLDAYYGEALG